MTSDQGISGIEPGPDLFHRHVHTGMDLKSRNALPHKHALAADGLAAGFSGFPQQLRFPGIINDIRYHEILMEGGQVSDNTLIIHGLHADNGRVAENIAGLNLFGQQGLVVQIKDVDRAAGALPADRFSRSKSTVKKLIPDIEDADFRAPSRAHWT